MNSIYILVAILCLALLFVTLFKPSKQQLRIKRASNYSKTKVKVLRVYVSNNDIYYICIKIGKLGVIHEFPNGIIVREESSEFVIKQSQINSGIIKVFDI